MQKVGRRMVVYFAVVIVLLVALGLYYLYLNDFSSETLEIVFPVTAAVLAAAYFGAKSVWIDAPATAIRVVPLAVLHDQASGSVSGLIQGRATDSGEDMRRFRALKELDTYIHYNAFKTLDVWGLLAQIVERDDSAAQHPIADLLEYAVLAWLGRVENLVGFEPDETTYQLQGFGAGGRPPDDLSPRSLKLVNEPNPFLAALEVQLPLPARSSVRRDRPAGRSARTLTMRTRHSTIDVNLLPGAVHPFVNSSDVVGRRIRENLLLDAETPYLWIYYFSMRFEFKQAPFSRFADQAKKEKQWVGRLFDQFEEDFSWERLRLHYSRRADSSGMTHMTPPIGQR